MRQVREHLYVCAPKTSPRDVDQDANHSALQIHGRRSTGTWDSLSADTIVPAEVAASHVQIAEWIPYHQDRFTDRR